MEEALIETWNIHNRVHLYLLDAIPSEALGAQMQAKGRSVYALFAHIHNTRLMWLQAAAPDLLADVAKLETKTQGDKALIADALQASGQAVESLLRQTLSNGGKVKGFKPHATAFVGYLIAHESHHRGQIEWALKSAGLPLSDAVSYGLWEWETR